MTESIDQVIPDAAGRSSSRRFDARPLRRSNCQNTVILLTPGVESGVRNGVHRVELTGRPLRFDLWENTDDLFIEKIFSSWGCPHVAYADITNIVERVAGQMFQEKIYRF